MEAQPWTPEQGRQIFFELVKLARDQSAHELHFEPTEAGGHVRVRRAGALHVVRELAPLEWVELVEALKVGARLDVETRVLPQDGVLRLGYRGERLDCRVSTLPVQGGERVTLHILRSRPLEVALDRLGYSPWVLPRLRKAMQGSGLLAFAGPTGAGKTTTQYSVLTELVRSDRTLTTVECPVEYLLAGVNQVNVRWQEMAETAASTVAQASDVLQGKLEGPDLTKALLDHALSGRLTLGSVHTSGAVAVLGRLKDLGMSVDRIARGVAYVQGQRLIRRLCHPCSEPVALDDATAAYFGIDQDFLAKIEVKEASQVRQARGCAACDETGYDGREPIAECFFVTEAIQAGLRAGASYQELTQIALDEGMIPLRQDALAHALRGTTSLEEVVRCLPPTGGRGT